MPRRAFRLAYDGRPFRGFQRQPDVPTVEDALFDALADLGVHAEAVAPDASGRRDPPPGYSAAGRTDAGVSAAAQTVTLEVPDWVHPRALNAELPAAVRAWAAADVPGDFHATGDASRRGYTYHLHAAGADIDRAREAASALSGEHDLHNLTPDDERTVRDIAVSVEADGEFIVLRVEAGGFPRELVRRLATLVEAVATGAAGLDRVERLLGPEPVSGARGVGPAPAGPLVLTTVSYPDVDFRVDEEAAASAGAVFSERRVAALQRVRVAETVLDGLE